MFISFMKKDKEKWKNMKKKIENEKNDKEKK